MVVNIPKLGVSMTEGTVAQWLVDDGGRAEAGQPLYVLETDKVENEIDAPTSGTVRHLVRVGETLPVGTPIAEIAEG